MAEYRAYAVGGDGHFIGYEPLICMDDDEAIEKAKSLVDDEVSLAVSLTATVEATEFHLAPGAAAGLWSSNHARSRPSIKPPQILHRK